ncbi:TadE/TadG family type IV pilus assembly protein [Parvularcula dongshanensis]|uniref:Uncharacterized protein n=1 Tax=Parvularcula dongshanensis TaxID=1173995 RepID=A0A840I7I7_9PROT|nr:pilus assembly protein [Parvularcula dongshanensis]MBB4660068.1 hypothetical protein [Parvularcula dongshanensis]
MTNTKVSLKTKLESSVFGKIAAFAKGERGAVTTWYAILLVPMLGFTFGAIKFSQLAEQRSGMIDAMDAAALGIARQYKLEDIEPCSMASPKTDEAREQKEALIRYGREFFRKNYPGYSQLYSNGNLNAKFDVDNHLTFEMDCAKITARADAFSDMGGILSTYFGVGAIPLNLTSEISLPGAGRVEIALVLDVTGSMSNRVDGERKIQTLKDAVKRMLDHDQFYGPDDDATNEFLKISVVPFNTMVNVDADYVGKDEDGIVRDRATNWMDGYGGKTPESYWHGSNFFFARENGSVFGQTPGPNRQTIQSSHVEVKDTKVNHFDLLKSVASNGATWKGCVEARPFPLDEVPVSPGTELTDQAYNQIFQQPSFVSGMNWNARKPWNNFAARKPWLWDPKNAKETYFVPTFAPDDVDCYYACSYDFNYESNKDHFMRAFTPVDPQGYRLRDPYGNYRVDFPGDLFDTVGPWTESHYVNQYVYDYQFTSPWTSDREDAERYRNLVLHARGQLGCSDQGYNMGNSPELQRALDRMGYTNSGCRSDEYKFREGYVGVWNGSKFVGRYEHASDSFRTGQNSPSSHGLPSTGPNAGCGGPVLPLTTKKKAIWNHVQKLNASGSTNTAVGLIWGWRTLTPSAPYIEAVDPNTPEGQLWRKFVVLMTDGNNDSPDANSHMLSLYTTYGFANENRLDLNFTAGSRSSSRAAFDDEMDAKTIRICHRMRESGIKVFTVGFDINSGSRADKMLQACAVDEDAYYFAESEDDLADAFESITSKIVELHISG